MHQISLRVKTNNNFRNLYYVVTPDTVEIELVPTEYNMV